MTYGNLGDVKKLQTVVEPTQDVKVKIDFKIESTKDGEARPWKFLSPTYILEDGVMVNGIVKHKGKMIFGNPICYFADLDVYTTKQESKGPKAYDYVADLKNLQHLVELSQIAKACKVELPISQNIGITDEEATELVEVAKRSYFKINIGQKKNKETGEMENTVGAIKACDAMDMV